MTGSRCASFPDGSSFAPAHPWAEQGILHLCLSNWKAYASSHRRATQNRRFGERAADHLQSNRQARRRGSARNRHGWKADKVEGQSHIQIGADQRALAARQGGRLLAELDRRQRSRRREQAIDAGKDLGPSVANLAANSLRMEIIDGWQKQTRLQQRSDVVAEGRPIRSQERSVVVLASAKIIARCAPRASSNSGSDTSRRLAPKFFELADGIFDRRGHGGIKRAEEPGVARNSQPQPLDRLFQLASVITRRSPAGRIIVRIRPGDDLQHGGGIGGRASQRPDMVHRPGQRHAARPTDATIRRLQSDQPAQRRQAGGSIRPCRNRWRTGKSPAPRRPLSRCWNRRLCVGDRAGSCSLRSADSHR